MSRLSEKDIKYLQERYVGGMGGLSEEAYACAPDVLMLMAALEDECARADRLRIALDGITEEFERTVRHVDSKGKGGQHVPFHGDFASACQLPSFISRARWWATHLRTAIKNALETEE